MSPGSRTLDREEGTKVRYGNYELCVGMSLLGYIYMVTVRSYDVLCLVSACLGEISCVYQLHSSLNLLQYFYHRNASKRQ